MGAALRPALGRLRLRHLELLELLEQLGTVRKASQQLNLSQPAVSQMVKEIEQAFGGVLFHRTRRGVVPNTRMELLLRRIRVALGEISAADREMEKRAAARPTLRVGANLHLLTHLLPQAVTRLREDYPRLKLEFSEGASAGLLRRLSAGELDFVVGRLLQGEMQADAHSELAFWPVYGGRLCVVAHVDHPLARRRKLRLEELAGADWALSNEGGQSRRLLANAFLRAGLAPPEPVIECRPFYVNMTITARLPLLTVVMRAEALQAQKQGLLRILPIDLDLDVPPIAFFCRRATAEDGLMHKLREAILLAGREIEGKSAALLKT